MKSLTTSALKRYLPSDASVELFGNTAIFAVDASRIIEVATDLYVHKKLRLKLITATDESDTNGSFRIWYVFSLPEERAFIVPYLILKDTEQFPSVTASIHEASGYERKIQTFFGLTPIGLPDQRPLILHENWPTQSFPLRKNFDWKKRPAIAQENYQFQTVEGEGIYEIPVGPIHAGIIEPGHFRFSVAGEEIILLEARLGFTHKGSEKLFEILSLDKQIRLAEKISGDSSFSHALAFCQAVEQLAGLTPPTRARYLRVIYAELERLANHFGDIGFIMLDTGYSFGGGQGSRLREQIIRIQDRLTGSRFLRGVNEVGGVSKNIDAEGVENLLAELEKIRVDFSSIIEIAEDSATLTDRLQGTGVLTAEVAQDCGVVGVAARAVGINRDIRHDIPYAAYDQLPLHKVETETAGDVYARFHVRVKEARASIELIQRALKKLPEGPITTSVDNIKLMKNSVAVSAVEGWRGEIIYFIQTDADGAICRVAPRDPSIVNWAAVGTVGAGNVVPDFPLINKSFNLSYTGNDL